MRGRDYQRLRLFGLGSLFLLAMCFAQAGCSHRHSGGKKMVVATTGMVGDLVRHVAGDMVELHELMGPGVDPHLYAATASDSTRLARADLIVYNGLHLEGRMVDLLERNPRAKAVTRDIPTNLLLDDEGSHDPHVWFDVSLWISALNAVEKDLIALDPANAELYKKNAADYRNVLETLHAEVKASLATIPKPQRVFITAHDAFRYFGRAYDIEVHGLQGVSTANQPGLKKKREIEDLIVARKVKAVFPESSVSLSGVNSIIEQCKARGCIVKLAEGELFSDAMGDPNTPEGKYPGMIRHNVRLVVNALK